MSKFKDDRGYYAAAYILVENTLKTLEIAEIDDEYLSLLSSCLVLIVDRRDDRVGSGYTFAGIVMLIKRMNIQDLSEKQKIEYIRLVNSVNLMIEDPRNDSIKDMQRLIL